MTSSAPDTTRPDEPARIHVKQFNGRTWVAQAVGQGEGFAWGAALAALDYYSHAHTDWSPPAFYLDIAGVRELRKTCTGLGVRVDGFVPSVA